MELPMLVQEFGPELLEYILGAEQGTLPQSAWEADFGPTPELTAQQRQAKTHLGEILDGYRGSDIWFQMLQPAAIATTIDRATGRVLANVLRSEAGAEQPSLVEADHTFEALLAIAADCFPALLLPRMQFLRRPGFELAFVTSITGDVDRIVYAHPRLGDAVEAVLADDDLARLVGRADEAPPLGTDGKDAVVRIVRSAAFATIASARNPAVGDLLRRTYEDVQALRQLASGEVPVLTAFIGIGGLNLDGDIGQMDTPFGRVHAAHPLLRLVGSTDWPPRGPIAEVVFQPDMPPGVSDADRHEIVRLKVRDLGLSCLLAQGKGPVPLQAWATDCGPANFGSSARGSHGLMFPQEESSPIEQDDARRVAHWLEVVATQQPTDVARITLAVDRIIDAAVDRWDARDALVDAVMAWENLVGSPYETTFTVTAALAILTVAEPSERPARRRELARAYDTRSNLVHGNVVGIEKVASARDVAIDAGVRAIRVLLADRVDLLRYAESRKRAEAIILGLRHSR